MGGWVERDDANDDGDAEEEGEEEEEGGGLGCGRSWRRRKGQPLKTSRSLSNISNARHPISCRRVPP